MIDYFKNVFLTIPTLMLSAIITSNILEYIQVLLKLSLPLQIYKQFLDRPSFTYMVTLSKNLRYENLAFIIRKNSAVANILKTMIFINLINNII